MVNMNGLFFVYWKKVDINVFIVDLNKIFWSIFDVYCNDLWNVVYNWNVEEF